MTAETSGRRSIRLEDYIYAQPCVYFVTICSHRRQLRFSRIIHDQVELTKEGRIVREEWLRTAEIRQEIELGEYVIMPNHLHAIVIITERAIDRNRVGAHGHAPLRRPARSLGSQVARFKGAVTRKVRDQRGDHSSTVWQRNYYERVIRDQEELAVVRRYIRLNPQRWDSDPYHDE